MSKKQILLTFNLIILFFPILPVSKQNFVIGINEKKEYTDSSDMPLHACNVNVRCGQE